MNYEWSDGIPTLGQWLRDQNPVKRWVFLFLYAFIPPARYWLEDFFGYSAAKQEADPSCTR